MLFSVKQTLRSNIPICEVDQNKAGKIEIELTYFKEMTNQNSRY